MSHYDVSYTDLPLPEKEAKAMQDIKSWLTERKFLKIHNEFLKEFRKEELTLEHFRFLVSLCGIAGYPVTVWYELLKKEIAEAK